jgi:hypothetical protein
VPDLSHPFDCLGDGPKHRWIDPAAAAHQRRTCFDELARMFRCFIV